GGDGVLGSVSGAPTNNGDGTYTATLAAPEKARRFYVQQVLTVMKSDFTVNRGQVEVTVVDRDGATITFKQADANAATLANIVDTDKFVPEGVTGTGTPTSLRGIPYHHSAASTGTWQNVDRANYPEIRT